MILTPNFTYEEMCCKCNYPYCNGGTMDPHFMASLQQLRDLCESPFEITSGFRCERRNSDVGGAPDSMHLRGRAADIKVTGESAFRIIAHAHECGLKGIGVGHSIIHLDDRTNPALWFYADR